MMKRICLIGITAVLALFCSCGKKGPILPPLVKIPKAVETAALAQIGTEFHLSWRLPTSYLDGSPIEKIEVLEIWIFEMAREVEQAGEVESPEPAEGEAGAEKKGKDEALEKAFKGFGLLLLLAHELGGDVQIARGRFHVDRVEGPQALVVAQGLVHVVFGGYQRRRNAQRVAIETALADQ